MAVIDHLVLAVPDLDVAIERFGLDWGVRPAFGGRHVGLGTHNALVSFGASYLELIAPDPTQPEPDGPRPFGVDGLSDARIVTWAVRPDPARGETLESLIEAARGVGHDPGDAVDMSRTTPDGTTLHWRLTFPTMAHDGLVPFLIDWGSTPHPATTAPAGIGLTQITGFTGDARRTNEILDAMGLDPIASTPDGHEPGLAARWTPAT